MLRYMQQATEAALGVGSGEFLDRFKAWGWFLDDLVLTPVNNLKNPAERIAKCRAAQSTRGHVALRRLPCQLRARPPFRKFSAMLTLGSEGNLRTLTLKAFPEETYRTIIGELA